MEFLCKCLAVHTYLHATLRSEKEINVNKLITIVAIKHLHCFVSWILITDRRSNHFDSYEMKNYADTYLVELYDIMR